VLWCLRLVRLCSAGCRIVGSRRSAGPLLSRRADLPQIKRRISCTSLPSTIARSIRLSHRRPRSAPTATRAIDSTRHGSVQRTNTDQRRTRGRQTGMCGQAGRRRESMQSLRAGPGQCSGGRERDEFDTRWTIDACVQPMRSSQSSSSRVADATHLSIMCTLDSTSIPPSSLHSTSLPSVLSVSYSFAGVGFASFVSGGSEGR
jgi:hypothetical protein